MDDIEESIFAGFLPDLGAVRPAVKQEKRRVVRARRQDELSSDDANVFSAFVVPTVTPTPVSTPMPVHEEHHEDEDFVSHFFETLKLTPFHDERPVVLKPRVAPLTKPAPAPKPVRKPAGPRPTTRILDELPAQTSQPMILPRAPVRSSVVISKPAPAPVPVSDPGDAMEIDDVGGEPVPRAVPPPDGDAILKDADALEPTEENYPNPAGNSTYKLLTDMDAFRAGESEEQQLWDEMHAAINKISASHEVIRRLEASIIGNPQYMPFTRPLEHLRGLVLGLVDTAGRLRDKNLKRTGNTEQLVNRATAISMGMTAARPEDAGADTDEYMMQFNNDALLPYETTETVNLNEFDI